MGGCRRALAGAAILLLALGHAGGAHALFGDDEARRAILEMRQRIDADQQRAQEDSDQMRRSMLELQAQMELLRTDLAALRGENENLGRQLSELQRSQRDMAQNLETRLSRFEPQAVDVDGQQFHAEPGEQRDYEAALARFRAGDFAAASAAFAEFVRRWPDSGYVPSARFWLGNAQYATRNYREAVASFRAMLAAAPGHDKAPEAKLSMANSQLELKQVSAARGTLQELIASHPQSEAAAAARERLSGLR